MCGIKWRTGSARNESVASHLSAFRLQIFILIGMCAPRNSRIIVLFAFTYYRWWKGALSIILQLILLVTMLRYLHRSMVIHGRLVLKVLQNRSPALLLSAAGLQRDFKLAFVKWWSRVDVDARTRSASSHGNWENAVPYFRSTSCLSCRSFSTTIKLCFLGIQDYDSLFVLRSSVSVGRFSYVGLSASKTSC